MGSCAVDRVSVLQRLQVNWEREPSVCHGGWGVAGGSWSGRSAFPAIQQSTTRGRKTAISNLQEGLVIVDVSFKLQMGAAKN